MVAGLIIGIAVIAAIVAPAALRLADKSPLGSELQRYVENGNPQNAADVDRLVREYQHKQSRNRLL